MTPDHPKPLKLTLTVTQTEQTVLDLLSGSSGLSKQRIKDALNKGAVWWTLKGKTLRLRRATKSLHKGSVIQLYYDEQVLARKPEAAHLIADAGQYSIWFKPHGMLAQGSQWGDHCSLLRWVELHLTPKRECFLVHRLDVDAAGLMLIAHNSKSAARLSELFQARSMRKHYQAWVQDLINLPPGGLTLDQPLDGKSAITHITSLAVNNEHQKTLLDIHIETGRKHQIRRHLADYGHPIIGDRLYGTATPQPLQLLAYHLSFICPFKQESITYELPQHMRLQVVDSTNASSIN